VISSLDLYVHCVKSVAIPCNLQDKIFNRHSEPAIYGVMYQKEEIIVSSRPSWRLLSAPCDNKSIDRPPKLGSASTCGEIERNNYNQVEKDRPAASYTLWVKT
jgi:hypothetical protein